MLSKSTPRLKILENFLFLSVLRGLQFLLPLVTIPYLFRTIGIEKFGLIQFAMSFSLYFGTLIQYGFDVTATREIAKTASDGFRLSDELSSTIGAGIFLAAVSGVFFSFILAVVPSFRENVDVYLATFGYVCVNSLMPRWFFHGIEKMGWISALMLLTNIIYVLGLLTWVKGPGDFVLVPLLQLIAASVTLGASLLVIRGVVKVPVRLPTISGILHQLRTGRHAFLIQMAPNLYNNSSVFILGNVAGPGSVGVYSSATKLIDAVCSLGYVISNSFFPHFARDIRKHYIFAISMIGTSLVLTIALIFFSRSFADVLFKSADPDLVILIKLVSLSVTPLFATLVFGQNYLMLVGAERKVRNVTIFVSILYFVFAMVAIPEFGIYGAAATLIGARLTMAGLLFVAKQRHDWAAR